MISKLCQRIQSLAGKEIAFHAISKRVRYAVKMAEVKPFLGKLGKKDLDEFKKHAAFSLMNEWKDKRSAVIRLEKPMEIEGRTILALRLKGVFPQASENGEVKRYSGGNGFLPRLLEPSGGTTIIAKSERPASEYSALGTMSFKTLEKEVMAATKLGPDRTDLLLGFGIYKDLHFNGKPVGFAVYGMERKQDLRVIRYLTSYMKKHGHIRGFEDLALHTGKLLREMHELKLVHKSSHLGNYGFLSQRETRLLDLETSFSLLSIPEEDRLAFLYLDLSRTIHDYQKGIVHESRYDEETDRNDIPLTPLLPLFLWGYFKGDTSLPFVKELQRFIDGNYKPFELSETFGRLPEFEDGWRKTGYAKEVTLIEPTIKLYTLPENSQIDLNDFRSHPFFDVFYQALESVASSI